MSAPSCTPSARESIDHRVTALRVETLSWLRCARTTELAHPNFIEVIDLGSGAVSPLAALTGHDSKSDAADSSVKSSNFWHAPSP